MNGQETQTAVELIQLLRMHVDDYQQREDAANMIQGLVNCMRIPDNRNFRDAVTSILKGEVR